MGIEAKLSGGPALEVDYNLTPARPAVGSGRERRRAGVRGPALLRHLLYRHGAPAPRPRQQKRNHGLRDHHSVLERRDGDRGAKSVQACFDAPTRKAAGSLPHTFSPAEINALAQSFAKTCLKSRADSDQVNLCFVRHCDPR